MRSPMKNQLSRTEFVALMAMLFATIAFSIDAMLPALPEIGKELSPDNLNRAQLILTSFVVGMGIGTFVTGPLSDTFGRKPIIILGAAMYILGALLAWKAPTLELVLVARVIQGLGAAGPRIVGIAIIRDLYEGREMARLMSFVMLVFSIIPALAPSLGAVIINYTGWRGIFPAFILFSLLGVIWLGLRQPETLPVAQRRPFKIAPMLAAIREMFANHMVLISIAVQTFIFASLFAMLSSVQQIFDVTFGRGESFPLWFMGIALVAATASIVNAALVVRIGMRKMVTYALAAQVLISGSVIILELIAPNDTLRFAVFVVWQTSMFFMMGLTLGNLNAMAMEPLGHIAGMVASMMAGIATVAAMVFAVPIGLAFDGTVLPLAYGIVTMVILGLGLMVWLARIEKRELV
ncbi:multidrug effflux MFS transporter [Rhodobacteraceae bacterium D3-12]|nr:multidrug effflux MFS transporter [Rhodobacteraceae bacterium D3-12]